MIATLSFCLNPNLGLQQFHKSCDLHKSLHNLLGKSQFSMDTISTRKTRPGNARVWVSSRVRLKNSSDLQNAIVHDGIHGTRSERRGNPLRGLQGEQPYRDGHQRPYNDAARRLLGK